MAAVQIFNLALGLISIANETLEPWMWNFACGLVINVLTYSV
jgi:hypothetical protein